MAHHAEGSSGSGSGSGSGLPSVFTTPNNHGMSGGRAETEAEAKRRKIQVSGRSGNLARGSGALLLWRYNVGRVWRRAY
jgi:hypothetical protein